MSNQLALGFDAPEAPRAAVLRHHHVRSHQPAEEAVAAEHRAKGQAAEILAWLDARPGRRFTPSEVHAALGGNAWGPINSVRRSLTNLTTMGDLVHHPTDRRAGPWGAPESTWSLA